MVFTDTLSNFICWHSLKLSMKKYISTALFYLLITQCSLAQNTPGLSIKGRVTDREGTGLPYISIGVKSTPSAGAFSNSAGKFEIYIPQYIAGDSLIFSSIGFDATRIKILPEYKDSITVVLNSKSYILNEIVLGTDSAENLIRRSIAMLNNNLSDKRHILQGFFREIVRSRHTYDRLIEAAVDVMDKGYKNGEGNNAFDFRIRELRKSEDYMDLDWMAAIFNYISPKNGLHGKTTEAIFVHDYIRNHASPFFDIVNAPLNDGFFAFADLSVDSMIVFDNDRLFCIGIQPREPNRDLFPAGTIYVREKDLAIIQMDYYLKAGTTKIKKMLVPGTDYLIHTLIKYKEYDGKMYPSMLYKKSFRQQGNQTKPNEEPGEGLFFDEKFFMVNDIITEKNNTKRFRNKEKQNGKADLYNEEWTYNEDFWKTYNAITETPLQPHIKSSLEREKSLESQYKSSHE